MKAKAVAYILFFWIFCFNVMAQDKDKGSIMEEVISLPFSSATISACFSLIKKKDIILSYNEGMIDINKICYFSQKNIKIKELLTNILSDYKTTIVVANPRKIIITVDRKNIYQLNGVVRETETLEKLYGAVLFFKKNGIIVSSCITNDSGFFSTALPEGTYNIETNYLGYLKSVKIVTLICNQRIDIFLKPMMLELGEVVISPQRSSANELSTSSPPNMLSYSNLDVLSEMKVFPGVIMSRSGADINVNGGGSEENLILLDGVPIYHNSHINYMLPVFNGSVIKNVNLYSSYFPARYEGKLSSILDIKIKEGNKKKHSRSLSLDIPSVAAMLEGPIKKEKASYMVSGRRSWSSWTKLFLPVSVQIILFTISIPNCIGIYLQKLPCKSAPIIPLMNIILLFRKERKIK
ncbi:carboxypeptidase-like regulatory domain-containing protein [Bacteroides caccae]|uniref:Carboxypeptidase-like regulatory domain-containing protein n=1 Tax=Bacteroides caccae TaxID=47678 RepID=A0AAW7WSU2_9BACE|nr:carboxypeptidase-like regulatory domain-containing protein [Bacteroides caccae]MDO6329352.1 carboxypeptidase-like regulatory domain-containing protein [Bacteroides caccae]MDO6339182.1 carboxypeptidase-like regulatory domain-containing protein [Bacteroides caccae]MDO6359210.1 carboxypeptidase-like regulatory domain-containing protein [Bacteroides caccae]